MLEVVVLLWPEVMRTESSRYGAAASGAQQIIAFLGLWVIPLQVNLLYHFLVNEPCGCELLSLKIGTFERSAGVVT